MKELWSDRSRIFGLPLSFTSYKLKGDTLLIRQGLLSTTEDQVKLFRVQDIDLRIGLFDRLFKQGTITLYTTDLKDKTVIIRNVLNPEEVRDLISSVVDESRAKHGIRSIETMDVYNAPEPVSSRFDDYI